MMIGKNKGYFIYILLFYILKCNFNVVNAVFPTSFTQINSTNGFIIADTRTSITVTHGDFNGDGNDDLIYIVQSLGLYVFYGPLPSNFDFQTDISKINGSNGFVFSSSVIYYVEASVGDINNDGFDDISFFLNISPGKVGVIYGTDQIISPSTFSTLDGHNGFYISHVATTNVAFGYVRSIIDFNADKIKDLFVSTAIGVFGGGTPVTYMIFGINGGKYPVNSQFEFDASTLNGNNGFVINDFICYNSFSFDVNNDGIDDIVLNRKQIGIDVIYGSRGPFTSPFIPIYDGVHGTMFNFSGSSIDSNHHTNGFGDFNNDGLNDFAVITKSSSNYYIAFIVYGKTKFPSSTILSEALDTSDGLVLLEQKTITTTWGPSPRLSDVNNDGFADLIINGGRDVPFRILFGSNKKYSSNPVYLRDIVDNCSLISIPGFALSIDVGDYNSDGIHDITAPLGIQSSLLGINTIYGKTSIGSIWIVNKLFQPNPITNSIYKLFENNINSDIGECAIRFVTLTIENPANDDQFIIDSSSFDSSIYSIAFSNENNTKVRIELILFGDQTKSIANDVLPKVSVLLSPQLFNRTISMKYGNNLQSIEVIGLPNANCDAKCLNGGTCDSFIGCQCINNYYGDYCELKDCTVPQCLNGGSCNVSVGECLCINDFYGIDCGSKDCTVPQCLNGGYCNTTVGECSCAEGYEGNDCSGISCSVPQCLNGGSCNVSVGECLCINDFYGIDCGSKDCTVPQCLNGGYCNTTVGECLCINDFHGIDCGSKDCTVPQCLNGGYCNTTVGGCSCAEGYEGTDCSGISCLVSCLKGGLCDVSVGECKCVDNYEGDDCGSQNKKKTNIGVIIGPILGGLALISIVVVAIVLIKKKRKNEKSTGNTNNIELRPQG
ncbi:hypothetical protein ACTFIU_007752 [Dictyostelium citrinum]